MITPDNDIEKAFNDQCASVLGHKKHIAGMAFAYFKGGFKAGQASLIEMANEGFDEWWNSRCINHGAWADEAWQVATISAEKRHQEKWKLACTESGLLGKRIGELVILVEVAQKALSELKEENIAKTLEVQALRAVNSSQSDTIKQLDLELKNMACNHIDVSMGNIKLNDEIGYFQSRLQDHELAADTESKEAERLREENEKMREALNWATLRMPAHPVDAIRGVSLNIRTEFNLDKKEG